MRNECTSYIVSSEQHDTPQHSISKHFMKMKNVEIDFFLNSISYSNHITSTMITLIRAIKIFLNIFDLLSSIFNIGKFFDKN